MTLPAWMTASSQHPYSQRNRTITYTSQQQQQHHHHQYLSMGRGIQRTLPSWATNNSNHYSDRTDHAMVEELKKQTQNFYNTTTTTKITIGTTTDFVATASLKNDSKEIINDNPKREENLAYSEDYCDPDDFLSDDFIEEDFVPDPSLIINYPRKRTTVCKKKNSRRKAKTKKKNQAKEPPKVLSNQVEEEDDDDDDLAVDDSVKDGFVSDRGLIHDHQSRPGKRKMSLDDSDEEEEQSRCSANDEEQKFSEQVLESDQYFLAINAPKEAKLESQQHMLHIQRCTDRLISLIPKEKVKRVPFDPNAVQNVKSAMHDLEGCEIPKSLEYWDTHALLRRVLCRKLVPTFLDNGRFDVASHQEFFKALHTLDQIKSDISSESKEIPKDTDPCNPQALLKVCCALNVSSTRASEPFVHRGKKTFKGAKHLESIRRCVVFLESFRARKCLVRNFDKSSNNCQAVPMLIRIGKYLLFEHTARKTFFPRTKKRGAKSMIREVPPCYLLGDFDPSEPNICMNDAAGRKKEPVSKKQKLCKNRRLKSSKGGKREESHENGTSTVSESHGRPAVIDLTDAPEDQDALNNATQNESHGQLALIDLTDAPEDRNSIDEVPQNDLRCDDVHPMDNSLEIVCGSLSYPNGPDRASRAKCASDLTNFSIRINKQESALQDLRAKIKSSTEHMEDLEGYMSASQSGLLNISPQIADLTSRENALCVLLQKYSTKADNIVLRLTSSSED